MADRSGGPDTAGSTDLASFEESYRVLRSNLSVSLSEVDRPSVMVTSANAGEGKSVTCINLALSFARAGQRVVIVDLDLRTPNAHRLVGAHNNFGVTDLLLGRRSLEDCLQFLTLPGPNAGSARGVYFIGTGPSVINPGELVSLDRTAQLLDGLAEEADLVLIDSPPVLPVADALVIGRMAAGAVLVVEARKTPVSAAAKAKDLLIRNKTRILGVVLNKVRPRDAGYDETYSRPADRAGTPRPEPGSDLALPARNG
ncbi:MAG: CpsD/CapB family tyrosine-protein kinase, partial [Actinomycetota bacterium]|nr:CpsD/CapB family tyrosine-protein kinase [Actinomycetota bacterium]